MRDIFVTACMAIACSIKVLFFELCVHRCRVYICRIAGVQWNIHIQCSGYIC